MVTARPTARPTVHPSKAPSHFPSSSPSLPTSSSITLSPSQSPTPPTTWSPTTTSPTTSSPTSASPSLSPTPPTCSSLPAAVRPQILTMSCQTNPVSLIPPTNLTLITAQLNVLDNCTALLNNLGDEAAQVSLIIAQPLSAFVFQQTVTSSLLYTVPSLAAFPAGLNLTSAGSLLCQPLTLSSLSAYPLVAVSYPASVSPPADFTASIFDSGLVLITAWNQTGLLDPATGLLNPPLVPGQGGYPFCVDLPLFSPVFWLGLNVIDPHPSFQPPNHMTIVVSAFSAISWTALPFSYPDSAHFSQYLAGVVFSALPFWAMAGLCLLLWPTFFCVRRLTCRRNAHIGTKQATMMAQHTILKRKLRPAPLKGRLCFLLVIAVLVVLIGIMLAGTAQFPSALNGVNVSTDQTQLRMSKAFFVSNASLTVALAANKSLIHVSGADLGAYQAELVALAQLTTLLNPLYYKASSYHDVDPLGILATVVRAVFLVVAIPTPLIVLWCLILASCTFRWKNDIVLCKTASRILGHVPRPLFVFSSVACWLCSSIAYVSVTLVGNACQEPSILGIPDLLPNNSVPLNYNPNGFSYSANGHNWASFYQACAEILTANGTVAQGTPYFPQVFSASQAHFLVLKSVNSSALPPAYVNLTAVLSSLVGMLNCQDFGKLNVQSTNALCLTYANTAFLGFVGMFFFPIVLMFMTPFIGWIMPNLFRIRQADLFRQSLNKAREGRIKPANKDEITPPVSSRSMLLRGKSFFNKKSEEEGDENSMRLTQARGSEEGEWREHKEGEEEKVREEDALMPV